MDFHQVIDGHFHLYGWDNPFAGDFWNTAEDYLRAGNFRSININALPSVERDVSNNIIAALFKLRHPQVYAHGGIIYDTYPVPTEMAPGMDTGTQYAELMEIGFDGIKMLETKPTEQKVIGRGADDEIYRDLFAAMERDGTHMVWHVADPDKYWDPERVPRSAVENGWFYGDGTYPTREEIYRQVFTVLERHPRLNVTFAHFFFMAGEREKLRQMFEKYPNVNVDLTPGTEMYHYFGQDPEGWRAFFERYADRIGYGTDCSDEDCLTNHMNHNTVIYNFLTTGQLFDVWGYRFQGLNLDVAARDKIVRENFLRRVGQQPKPIDVTALKRYVEKYRSLIRDAQVRRNIDVALAQV